jgi:hypothetical protein
VARILTQLDAPMWRIVRQLYLDDKVVEALHEAERLGGQDTNDLYAESKSRTEGETFQLNNWLRVEAIAAEIPQIQELLPLIQVECERLSQRFGWDNRQGTLITFLPQEVEQPWMPGRYGYFVDKVPYDKICLPYHLSNDPSELVKTVRHEFMHGITLHLSNGNDPRWLTEALATYIEDRDVNRYIPAWRNKTINWLSPDELNGALEKDNRDESRQTRTAFAYSQACAIARFLVSSGGERRLGELLEALGKGTIIHGLGERFLGRSRTDSAMREVYGFGEAEGFEYAKDWVLGEGTSLR